MKLLEEQELIWSAIVADTRMNRKRKASGINSYEKEFRFKPEKLLRDYIERFNQVKWLDLCCGEGNALLQGALHLAEHHLQDSAKLKGIDLIDGL
jgi:tRNA G46 methylase TrmB